MRLSFLLAVAAVASAQTTVQQHMMLIEPTGTELNVNETLIVSGQKTAKVSVAIPPAAGTPTVRNGQAAKTRTPGVFEITVDNAAQEARVDLAWSIPFVVPEMLSGRILHPGTVRMVFPKGVKVSGSMLELNGTEPTTMASIYTVRGASYRIEVDGAGSLRAQQQPEANSAPEDGPSIEQIHPRIYDRLYWILGLVFAVLAIGFALNYRASVASEASEKD